MTNAYKPIFNELPKKINNNFYYIFKTKFFPKLNTFRKISFVNFIKKIKKKLIYIIKRSDKLLKKYLIKFGLVGTLTFFVFLVYFYKTSGKFCESVLFAFVDVTVVLSMPQPVRAGQADAFT